MKKVLLCASLALATIAGLSTLLQAQTTPTSAAPATPVPMETPDPKLYNIPKTTPAGMPAYSLSPSTGGATVEAPRGPTTAAGCDHGRWKSFDAMGFKSQAECREWVKQHPPAASGSQATATRSPAITPRARRTPGINPPSPELTPGSSITPFLNPTPNSR